MLRLTLLTVSLWGSICVLTLADDPTSPVVVAADQATAAALAPLPANNQLLVLIQNEDEPDEVIHNRALAMRHATHFVYLEGQETPMSAIYRERLTNQGAVAINLSQYLPVRRGKRLPAVVQALDSFLATLSIRD